MRAVGAELEGRVGGVQIVRGWKLVRATLLSAAVCAGLFGIVSPAWARTKLRIADPGRASARVVRCSSSFDTDCGGSIEINGQEYGFAGGALAGRVDSSGRFGRGHASFGVASTDPATQGPFQLRFSLVTAGSASGRFVSSGHHSGSAPSAGCTSSSRFRSISASAEPTTWRVQRLELAPAARSVIPHGR
jgi:hypothetical protein